MMRFVMLASGPIARRCLNGYQTYTGGGLELAGIVAPPDILEDAERGPKGSSALIKLELSPANRQESEVMDLLESARPDFVISVQYPWILSPSVLECARGLVLNLHNAKLPDYRGHNTISHEILNREILHTSTLHWMVPEVDRGLLAMERNIEIQPEDTAYSLWKRSADSCVQLFADFLGVHERVVKNKEGSLLPPGGSYYSKAGLPRLKLIPENATREDVDRIARAFCFPPHEPAYFLCENRKLYVLPHTFHYSL